MTQVVYPQFAELVLPVSQAYMETLLQPYADALSQLNLNDGVAELEALRQWIPLVLPGEHGIELLNIINNNEELITGLLDTTNPIFYIGEIRRQILMYIGSLLLEHVLGAIINQPITPWDLAKYRNEELTHLFGPGTDRLTVIININNNQYQEATALAPPNKEPLALYQHVLTEEFTYGLIISLQDTKDFSLFLLGDVLDDILDENVLENRFTDREQERYSRFVATTTYKQIFFDTPDFIQGVITGAQWRNVDPHTIITKLSENNFGVETTLNF